MYVRAAVNTMQFLVSGYLDALTKSADKQGILQLGTIAIKLATMDS